MYIPLLTLFLPLTLASPLLLPRQTSLRGTNITLLPLGDSITYGFVDPSTNGYRAKLYSSLSTAGASPLDFLGSIRAGNFADGDNEGRIGYTIQQIAGATTAISNLRPNIVLLHAGTNDALRRYETSDKAIPRLGQLIDQVYTQWPGVTLIVAKLVPDTEAAAQTYIDDINAAIPGIVAERAAQGKKISIVDMSPPFLTTADLVDGIHPTVAGYEKMADIWLAGIEAVAAKGWLGAGGSSSPTNPSSSTTASTIPTSSTPSSASSSAPAPPSSTTTPVRPATTAQPATTASTTTPASAPAPAPTTATVPKYGQCGGQVYSGPTTCEAGSVCKFASVWYSQCV
ncbi:Chitin synthase 3 [Sphaceloma murrayae]|uniref:Chitin synthase 3 n=1 Tax=Sphaceloma murrayae TaxID=2082308 RepID=A0A2K1R053_9PEZI|nr:Chitin synthase 3 [Sphaceloma murrayae]